jgi:hypothetical protein
VYYIFLPTHLHHTTGASLLAYVLSVCLSVLPCLALSLSLFSLLLVDQQQATIRIVSPTSHIYQRVVSDDDDDDDDDNAESPTCRLVAAAAARIPPPPAAHEMNGMGMASGEMEGGLRF